MPLPALCTLVGGLLGDGYTAMMGLAVGSILTTLTAATAFELRFRKATRASSGAVGQYAPSRPMTARAVRQRMATSAIIDQFST